MEETKTKKPNNGPNFMKMLLGKRVNIGFCDDSEQIGIIRGFNRYEVLLEREGDAKKILVMKHAISEIVPLEGDPFEKEEEEDENKTRT